MMAAWSKSAVLSLYRSLMRKGRTLELTNKFFYYRKIRWEFKQNINLQDEKEKIRCLEVNFMYFFLHITFN